MAVIALAPSSSLALIFTMKLKGDVIMAGNICSLSILLSTIAMTILQRLRKPDPNGKPRRIRGGDWKYVIMFGLGGVRLYETGRSAMRRGEIGLHVKGIQRDTDILKDFELLRRLALI